MEPTRPHRAIVAGLLGAAALAGCGSSSTSTSPSADATGKPPAHQTTAPAQPIPASSSYNPHIVPSSFTNRITNPYFFGKPGTTVIMKGAKDGTPQTHTTHITRNVRTIIGVPCVVVKDVVTDPHGVAEIAYDWYAQDAKGNVWYFGESTTDYDAKGVATSTKGSWEAGVDNAKPGIILPADPKPGPAFYQEFRPGIAEDKGQVLSTGETVRIKSGTYHDVIRIRDTNPLDPTLVQSKWYARGVGLVKSVRTGSSHTETSQLVGAR